MEFDKSNTEEYEIEDFLELMTKNRKPTPKDFGECENFKYLNVDEEYLYFGRSITNNCEKANRKIIKLKLDHIEKFPWLRNLKGWEFSDQMEIKDLVFSDLVSELGKLGIYSWNTGREDEIRILNEGIEYTRTLKVVSKGNTIKCFTDIGVFETETMKLIRKRS